MQDWMVQMKTSFTGGGAPVKYIDPLHLTKQETAAKYQEIEVAITTVLKRAQEFSSNQKFWRELLSLSEEAKIAAAEKRWVAAELALTEATVLVNRAIGSESLLGVRIWLALAPVLWFILLYFFQFALFSLSASKGMIFTIVPAYFPYLWMGMLGGTTVVLWGIVKHGKELSFDRAFTIWYLFKPALGAIMGVLVVLVIQSGYLTLQGDLEIKHTTALLVLAFLAGFSERFFIKVIDKVVTAVLGGDDGSAQASPAPRRSATPTPKVDKGASE